MRALADDREITATLGVPVRRVEAAAWFGSGLACGAAGLILADLLTSLDYSALDVPRHLGARGGADRPAAVALGDDVRRARRRVLRSRCSARTPRFCLPLGGAVRARDRRAPVPLATPRRHVRAGDGLVEATPGDSTAAVHRRRRWNGERSPAGPPRSHSSRSRSVSCRRSWVWTGSRPSRAWRSTRSRRWASAFSTAASA